MSDTKFSKPLAAKRVTAPFRAHAPNYRSGRAAMPTARQLRDLDARIERMRKDAIQTLADIQAIGRR